MENSCKCWSSGRDRHLFEVGWERSCYDFQLGTFNDSFMDSDATTATADFARDKIHSIVRYPHIIPRAGPQGDYVSFGRQ